MNAAPINDYNQNIAGTKDLGVKCPRVRHSIRDTVFDKLLAVHVQHANDKSSAEEWCHQDDCSSLVPQRSNNDKEFPDTFD
jgi:hypothetical protein